MKAVAIRTANAGDQLHGAPRIEKPSGLLPVRMDLEQW